MAIDGVFGAEFEAHLPDRFEEGKRFDIAHGAADFDDDHVDALGDAAESGLDLVGDVGNHLHGLAEVIAAPLLCQDRFVDAAAGPVIFTGQPRVGEPFVVAEVEIGLGAVLGNVHLAMLIGRHRPGINVQVGIALLEGDAETTAFEQAAN